MKLSASVLKSVRRLFYIVIIKLRLKYKYFTKQAVTVFIFTLQLAFERRKKIQIERRFSNERLKIKTVLVG